MTTGSSPSFKVFTVSDREWKDPKTGEVKKGWWTRIGTAFAQKDGFSINFDALPVPTLYEGAVQTRVVLRPMDSEEEEEPEARKKAARK